MNDSGLNERHCKPCEGSTQPLAPERADALVAQLDGWVRRGSEITRIFEFQNYYETMAFVNAVAYLSHRQDHHPDLTVTYRKCMVTYTTHAIDGLSENDFICAAKVNALVED